MAFGSECVKCTKSLTWNQKKGSMCSVYEKRTQEDDTNNVTLVQDELIAYADFICRVIHTKMLGKLC